MTAGNPRNVGRALPARLQLLLPFGAGTLCRASPSTPSRCPGRILSHQGRAESNSAQSWPRPEQCASHTRKGAAAQLGCTGFLARQSPTASKTPRGPDSVLPGLELPTRQSLSRSPAPSRPWAAPSAAPGPYGPGQKTTARAPGTGRSQNKGFKLQPRIPPVPVLKQNLARHQ